MLRVFGTLTAFEVSFDCVNDPAKSTKTDPGHKDYRYTARLNQTVLDGETDTDPEDDLCPGDATSPFEVDPNPDGTIEDTGCARARTDLIVQ